jgi:hypothetical protein
VRAHAHHPRHRCAHRRCAHRRCAHRRSSALPGAPSRATDIDRTCVSLCAPARDRFHIPPPKRRWVVALLCGNAFFQYATQLCRFAWPSYNDSQTMPGVLWINLTFVCSILCGISSGIMQGAAEGEVRKAEPGRFPPTPIEFALEAWKKEREEARAKQQPPTTAERVARRLSTAGAAMAAAAALPTDRLSVVLPTKRRSMQSRSSFVSRGSEASGVSAGTPGERASKAAIREAQRYACFEEAGGKDSEAGGKDSEAGGKDSEAGGKDSAASAGVASTGSTPEDMVALEIKVDSLKRPTCSMPQLSVSAGKDTASARARADTTPMMSNRL